MIHYKPLGHHPRAKNLRPWWVSTVPMVLLVILTLVLVGTILTGENFALRVGFFLVFLGGNWLIDAWYGRRNLKTIGSKLVLSLSLFFVIFGLSLIIRSP